jgi:hypothetical protein
MAATPENGPKSQFLTILLIFRGTDCRSHLYGRGAGLNAATAEKLPNPLVKKELRITCQEIRRWAGSPMTGRLSLGESPKGWPAKSDSQTAKTMGRFPVWRVLEVGSPEDLEIVAV